MNCNLCGKRFWPHRIGVSRCRACELAAWFVFDRRGPVIMDGELHRMEEWAT